MTTYYTYKKDAEAHAGSGTVDFRSGYGYYVVAASSGSGGSGSSATSPGGASPPSGATNSAGSSKPVAGTGSAAGGAARTAAGTLSPSQAAVQPTAANPSATATRTAAPPSGVVYYASPLDINLSPGQTIGYTPGKGYYAIGAKTSVTPPTSKAIVTHIGQKPAPSPPQSKTATKPTPARAAATNTVTRATTVLTPKPAPATPTSAKATSTKATKTTAITDKTVYYANPLDIDATPGETIAYAPGRGYYTITTAERSRTITRANASRPVQSVTNPRHSAPNTAVLMVWQRVSTSSRPARTDFSTLTRQQKNYEEGTVAPATWQTAPHLPVVHESLTLAQLESAANASKQFLEHVEDMIPDSRANLERLASFLWTESAKGNKQAADILRATNIAKTIKDYIGGNVQERQQITDRLLSSLGTATAKKIATSAATNVLAESLGVDEEAAGGLVDIFLLGATALRILQLLAVDSAASQIVKAYKRQLYLPTYNSARPEVKLSPAARYQVSIYQSLIMQRTPFAPLAKGGRRATAPTTHILTKAGQSVALGTYGGIALLPGILLARPSVDTNESTSSSKSTQTRTVSEVGLGPVAAFISWNLRGVWQEKPPSIPPPPDPLLLS